MNGKHSNGNGQHLNNLVNRLSNIPWKKVGENVVNYLAAGSAGAAVGFGVGEFAGDPIAILIGAKDHAIDFPVSPVRVVGDQIQMYVLFPLGALACMGVLALYQRYANK